MIILLGMQVALNQKASRSEPGCQVSISQAWIDNLYPDLKLLSSPHHICPQNGSRPELAGDMYLLYLQCEKNVICICTAIYNFVPRNF